MRVLYFDTIAGISGDMTVGALLALGLPFEHLRDALRKLPVNGYLLGVENRQVNGIHATKFDVLLGDHHHDHGHAHRSFREIRAMLQQADLEMRVRELALRIFSRLAEAEAHVHGMELDAVTFHEVGAVDSIVDIVGTAIGVAYFGIERAFVSSLPLGSGIVHTQHGPLPVPGPATAQLLRGFQTRFGEGSSELITPTGAAIIAALAAPGPVPAFRIDSIGYGAGTRTLTDRPNLLRLVLGELETSAGEDELIVLETNIDDSNPEIFDHVFERLFEAGARDVWMTAVHMKKNRPGVVLSVLAAAAERDCLAQLVLSETSAIGLRMHTVQRQVLPRAIREVDTEYGKVRVKVAQAPDGHANVAPEYDDCRRLARERNVPLKLVYQAALAAFAK